MGQASLELLEEGKRICSGLESIKIFGHRLKGIICSFYGELKFSTCCNTGQEVGLQMYLLEEVVLEDDYS